MVIYAESSAAVAWLFRESRAFEVETLLQAATRTVASDLTLIECDRALRRAVAARRIDEKAAQAIHSKSAGVASAWDILSLVPAIVQRARGDFPGEPIRSLDALHVAWALHAKAVYPQLSILSLDDRVRRVSAALGVAALPA
ncbi:MAG: PIN domain-containing protein [Alphaproteobacteria bacterium]|nr:PIN domain-containing protein [Alphaproteobacteria bacterium]MBV9695119.1 PIN domain-containing protein [Alphaproteobacteria bacterium]